MDSIHFEHVRTAKYQICNQNSSIYRERGWGGVGYVVCVPLYNANSFHGIRRLNISRFAESLLVALSSAGCHHDTCAVSLVIMNKYQTCKCTYVHTWEHGFVCVCVCEFRDSFLCSFFAVSI